MLKAYMGIDVGASSCKGVIIDGDYNILCSEYLYNEGNILDVVKKLVSNLETKFDSDKYKIISVGVTGVYRKIAGIVVDASVIKNEILSHGIGAISCVSNVKSVLDVSDREIKFIKINDGEVIDYEVINFIDGIDCLEKIEFPVVLQGGYSKDSNIINFFNNLLGCKVIVDDNSCLMGALGVAVLACNSGMEKEFDFNLLDIKIDVLDGVKIFRGDKIINSWGNKCLDGEIKVGS